MGCGSSSQKPVARRGYQAKNEVNGQAGTTADDTVGPKEVSSPSDKENNNPGTTSNSQVNLQVEPEAQKTGPTTESEQEDKETETQPGKPTRSSAPPVQADHTLATYSSRNNRLSNDRAKRNLAAHTSRNENVASNYGKRKLSKYSSRNEQIATPSVKKVKEPNTVGGTPTNAAPPPEDSANGQQTVQQANGRSINGQQTNGQQANEQPANVQSEKDRNDRNKQNLVVPSSRNQEVSSSYGNRNLSKHSPRNQQIATPRGKKDGEPNVKGKTNTTRVPRESKQSPSRNKHISIPSGREDGDPNAGRDTTDTARTPREPKQNGEFEFRGGPSKRKKILAESSERLKRMEEESDNENNSPRNAPTSNRDVNRRASPVKSNRGRDRYNRSDKKPAVSDRSRSSPRRSVRPSNKVGPSESSYLGSPHKAVATRSIPKRTKGPPHQETGPKRKRNTQQQTPRNDDPNERAQLRRIRQMLRDATCGNDVYDLDEAIWHFEKQGLEDNGDLTAALERMDYLQLRLALREAILRRHLGTLDRAIDDAINSDHEGKLRNLTRKAEELRDHLRALDRYSHDILDMDQKVISEIRSYCNPPPSVHEVMAACYMLLGTKEDRLLEWAEIQSYVSRLGRDSLRKMIRNFDTDSVPVEVQLRVKEILNSYNLEEVRGVSNGVATFYIWAKNMIDLLDKRSLQESGDETDRSKSTVKQG